MISLILTVNNRAPEVSLRVAESLALPGNAPDELIVVLDRPTPEAREGAIAAYTGLPFPVKFAPIDGEPGWLCPAKAWNVGFREAAGKLVYCISSETVQAEGNVARAVAILAERPAIVFGRAECSCGPSGTEVNWGGAAPGNLLVDAAHTRPLGFIWAGPVAAVRQIGGFDEGFMRGLWHDDDDFFFRLWRTGLPFIFDDSISGTHLHHERPDLDQKRIGINRAYMASKHGTLTPWSSAAIPGRTVWEHP